MGLKATMDLLWIWLWFWQTLGQAGEEDVHANCGTMQKGLTADLHCRCTLKNIVRRPRAAALFGFPILVCGRSERQLSALRVECCTQREGLGNACSFIVARHSNVCSLDRFGGEHISAVGREQIEFRGWFQPWTHPNTSFCLSLHGAGWRYVFRVRMMCIVGQSQAMADPWRLLNAFERSHRSRAPLFCPYDGWNR